MLCIIQRSQIISINFFHEISELPGLNIPNILNNVLVVFWQILNNNNYHNSFFLKMCRHENGLLTFLERVGGWGLQESLHFVVCYYSDVYDGRTYLVNYFSEIP